MQSIFCPHCRHAVDEGDMQFGSAKPRRLLDPEASHQETIDYLFMQANVRGIVEEHWYHAAGCRQWILVTRDTTGNRVIGSRALTAENAHG
jgi:methylglutamate dehydrogenase subunit B